MNMNELNNMNSNGSVNNGGNFGYDGGNGKKSNNWLIILLVLIIVAMGSYIFYDKVLSSSNSVDSKNVEASKNVEESKCGDDTNTNDNTQTGNETKKDEEKNETATAVEVTIDKDAVNEKLNGFGSAYYFAFGNISSESLSYDVNILDSRQKAFDFAWEYAILDKVQKSVANIDSNGEEVDGAYAIDYNSFATYYKKLLGVDLNSSYYGTKYKCVLGSDNMLYYGIYTNFAGMNQIFKVNKVTKLRDEYTVILDVLYFDSTEYEDMFNYMYTSEYPESEVDYKMEVVATKNDDMYTFKSIKFVK